MKMKTREPSEVEAAVADGPRQPQVEALADQALSQVAGLDGKAQAGGKRRVAQEVALQQNTAEKAAEHV